MSNFKELQTNYDEVIKTYNVEFKRIITEVLPMESGFAYKVKTYPFLTIEQAENAHSLIEKLRENATSQRDEVQSQRNSEIEAKIKELGDIIGMKDLSKKTSKEAKWVTEARSHSVFNLNGSLSASSFWRDTIQAMKVISKWIQERKEIERKKTVESDKEAEATWCKQYIISCEEESLFTEEIVKTLSNPVAIEMAHTLIKNKFSKENELSSEKCYCEDHSEMRHYHFAETYWNSKEVIVYENSETY
jgi:hypothetical protein